MTTPLAQHRARESLKAAQRASLEQRRQQAQEAQEASASTWWSDAKPTRCLICHADVPLNYKPGQELACGH